MRTTRRVLRASAIAWALAFGGATATAAEPLCVLDVSSMPESWRPAGPIQKSLGAASWSDAETKDASDAAQRGLDELSGFYATHPAAVEKLGINTVESLLDSSYAAVPPAFQTKARDAARDVLTKVLMRYLTRNPGSATCREYSTLLAFAIYAHALLPVGDARTSAMVALSNGAYRACGSLDAAMGGDYRRTLATETASIDEVWDLVMWSIVFTDAQTVPGVELAADARDLPPTLWRYLEHYRLTPARAYSDGVKNKVFYDTAYLVTHIAYIPTGYGRYAISVADAPRLYGFLRENFYAVLEYGELDLTAEFVDLFRQYGCTEQNDLQLRDGTRYLLRLFHAAGSSWMAHREAGEPRVTDDYDAIHKAWTGISGVRVRVPENPELGTYGGIVRAWIDHSH